MREIIGRIDAPGRAGAIVRDMSDAIQHGITEINVRRGHVDFGAEHMCAVREFSRAHPAKEVEVFFYATRAKGTGLAWLSQRASVSAHFVGRQAVDIGAVLSDQRHRVCVEALKVVGGKEQLIVPVKAEPTHIVLNRLDIFGVFRRRISIVHAEMADAPRLFIRNAEVEANRFGMADMEIAVRFRWEAGDDPSGMFTCGTVGSYDLTNEVGARRR